MSWHSAVRTGHIRKHKYVCKLLAWYYMMIAPHVACMTRHRERTIHAALYATLIVAKKRKCIQGYAAACTNSIDVAT